MKKIKVSLSPQEHEAIMEALGDKKAGGALGGAIRKLKDARETYDEQSAVRKPSMQSKKSGRAATGFAPVGPGVKS